MATKTTKKMAPKGPMKMKESMPAMKKGGAAMPAYKKGGTMKKGKC